MPNPFQIETQQKHNWCWAAVSDTVAHYFFKGVNLTQAQIAKETLGASCSNPDGCDVPARLEDALRSADKLLKPLLPGRSLNTQLLLGRFLTFEAIRSEIDAGRPVCVRIQWSGEDGGHFVMISGYSVSASGEEWVDVADPFYEDSIVPYDQFVTAYLNAGEWSDTYLVSHN
jgi:hypothetical protein